MTKCKECGSFAINHHLHGREGSDGDLCDVCYWRKRAQAPAAELGDAKDAARYRWLRNNTGGEWAICEWSGRDEDGAGYYADCRHPEIIDAAIDAAMAPTAKEQL